MVTNEALGLLARAHANNKDNTDIALCIVSSDRHEVYDLASTDPEYLAQRIAFLHAECRYLRKCDIYIHDDHDGYFQRIYLGPEVIAERVHPSEANGFQRASTVFEKPATHEAYNAVLAEAKGLRKNHSELLVCPWNIEGAVAQRATEIERNAWYEPYDQQTTQAQIDRPRILAAPKFFVHVHGQKGGEGVNVLVSWCGSGQQLPPNALVVETGTALEG